MEIKFGFGTRLHAAPFADAKEWDKNAPQWKQVHGTEVAQVRVPQQECGEVDALWTSEVSLPIAVKTADCIPILLKRRDLQAVAAIHAGWKGIELHVISKFFEKLPESLADPKEWIAMIGPSNRVCCYEFGSDLIEKLGNAYPTLTPQEISPRPGYLDLITIARHELESLGIQIESVHPDCTYCAREPNGALRYFSYRQGDRNSRQFSGIMLAPSSRD